MNKDKKDHRSRVKGGYYQQQFLRTEQNKARRALKRKRRAALWKQLNAL